MSLAPGTRLGAYEVLGLIGAGGVGELYRALDSKLNRDVAIKVLPDSFDTVREHLARFQREAHVLASLKRVVPRGKMNFVRQRDGQYR
jgi:serine/threonine protein kinase